MSSLGVRGMYFTAYILSVKYVYGMFVLGLLQVVYVQLSAVITRSNIIGYCMNHGNNEAQKVDACGTFTHTPSGFLLSPGKRFFFGVKKVFLQGVGDVRQRLISTKWTTVQNVCIVQSL